MERHEFQRKKIYGGVQRLLHAWIGLTVLALMILGWIGQGIEPGAFKQVLTQAHIALGYALIVGLVLRLTWGMIGPDEARLARLLPGRQAAWGHEPLAALCYLACYSALILASLTGLMLAGMRQDQGPLAAWLFDDLRWLASTRFAHDAMLYLLTAFVVLHIGALIHHEKERGYPLAQGMLSGYQYRALQKEMTSYENDPPSHSHAADTDPLCGDGRDHPEAL